MNKTLADARLFATSLASVDRVDHSRIQRFIIPPFTAVREVKEILKSSSVKVGAQNMHWADQGAWTGEISPVMLRDCDLDIVELGHSERREHFGETDETVALKTAAAVRHGLIPLICVGETFADRESGRASEVLAAQVEGALSKLSEEERNVQILLAYEPVWAIGDKGVPATASYADQQQKGIVAVAERVLGRRIPCLYGGSVNHENCQELISSPNIDGLFIGRSAWQVAGYLTILDLCAKTIEENKL